MSGCSVDSVRVFVKSIITEFVLNIQQDQNAAGDADSQSGYVEYGIEFVAPEIP
jgi:hypothetical protein